MIPQETLFVHLYFNQITFQKTTKKDVGKSKSITIFFNFPTSFYKQKQNERILRSAS